MYESEHAVRIIQLGNRLQHEMAKDLFLLQNEGKITQKYVNDAANKRLAMHLKKQSNINFGSTDQGTFAPDNRQSEMDKLAAIMFAK